MVTPVNMQATQCHSVTPPPPWPARDYGDYESNIVTLCDSETETDPSALSDAELQPQTTRTAGRQLTLIDGSTGV